MIDLDALRHNYRLARRLGGGRALAIIKADAYGHGAVECARALAAEADGFGVACIEEALQLRDAGIEHPILLLEGFFHADELPLIARHRLWCVLGADWQLQTLRRRPPTQPLRIWLKLDSGMHRLGLAVDAFGAAWRWLHDQPWLYDQPVAMTHFARADEPDNGRTEEQIAQFDAACRGLNPETVSIANSAALLAWPAARRGIIRPGLMLYGATPFARPRAEAAALRPVMRLCSQVIAVHELAAGEPIGYGGTYVTPAPTRVGVVAIGYADGYPQHAPEGTPVVVAGRRSRVIGRVSMDMLTIDLSALPEVGPGAEVELWGSRVAVADVAAHTGASAYALLTGLKRAPRRYLAQAAA